MTSTGRSMELSVATVCRAVWTAETQLALLDWQIDGVSIWPVIRMRVFHELSRRSGIHGDPHPVRRGRKAKAKLVTHHLTALLRQNPFLGRRQYDAVMVPHHRKIDGKDIYSDAILAGLDGKVLVLDSSINGSPLPNSRTLDFFTSAANAEAKVRQKLRIGLSTVDAARALQAEEELHRLTGIKVPISGLVTRELTKHRRLRAVYRALFSKTRPGTVYVVVAYFHQHVVAAARDLGIPVVELQHGAMSPFHLGYSYPGRPEVADQPNELWCFGKYWTENVELPAGMTTRVVGAPFIRRLTEAEAKAKDPNLVLVASQGTIGSFLLPVAVQLAEKRPELEVVFRLHPSEHLTDYERTDFPKNFRLSAGPSESTNDLLTAARYQVGVSTTALFEGMVLGCRTVVVKLPGWEYLGPAIDRGDALLVEDGDDLVRRLSDAPACRDSSDYYAPGGQTA
ncbi:hypothetical protein [Kribbella deserti]|uniref:Uncharacterized protein n=1 Tax=Kribbella deserti TaxID=1926257 RepID=A0ABV6QKF1_9ACTN